MQKQRGNAVLFDYDGVLADTMRDNFQAWKYAFEQQGCSIQLEEYMVLEGMSPHDIAKTLGHKHKLNPVLYPQIADLKDRYYHEHYSFRIYPNIAVILAELNRANIKLALVSGAVKHRVFKITPQKILGFFSVIVTAYDVKRAKPHPEPYQKALRLLGLSPAEAVAIENAPLGIQSAKQAGVYCIALTTTLAAEYLNEADEIVKSHEDLLPRLKEFFLTLKNRSKPV